MKVFVLLLSICLCGCSSSSMVTNWKNPDVVLFDADKVLIVGMTPNEEARIKFETQLQIEFSKRNVDSFMSFDLFDVAFTSSEKSEEQLSEVEQQLLDKDFDAILFTKIIGSDSKKTFRQRVSDIDGMFTNFSDDYLHHQEIYYETGYYDEYKVYHAETSLYCICVGKERELIWRGTIDITDPKNIDKTVQDYVKLIVYVLQEQDLIFRKEHEHEVTRL